MKKIIGLMFLVAAAFGIAPLAQAADGPWMVRVRAVHLDWANESAAGNGALGIDPTVLPANAVEVKDKTIPELDISYFFTKNIAAELILTYPQKLKVRITQGPLAEEIGSFKALPPTLTLQYHFLPDGQFRPYVGAGINYTRISSVNLRTSGGATIGLEKDSMGPAVQVGLDIKVGRNLFLNLDVKKIYIDSDITVNGTKVSQIDLDPWAFGVGIGFRF